MIKAIYAGSFDPMHVGHEDIIERASNLVDVLYVAVLTNNNKTHFLTIDERLDIIQNRFSSYKNIKIITFDCLLVEFCKKNNITFIIKGIRNQADLQLELDMAQGIRHIDDSIETLFISTNPKYSYISSTMIRDLAKLSGNLEGFVSEYTNNIINDRGER